MIDGRRLLGVLDCAEPLAGAVFMQRLTAAAQRRGGAAVPVVLWSDAAAPGPRGDAGAGCDAPAGVLLGLHVLERAGADAVVIPGAAAHAWYRDLAAAAHVPIMHLIECTVAELRRARPGWSRVAVLAETGNAGARLLETKLREAGFGVETAPPHVEGCASEAAERAARGDWPGAGEILDGCLGGMGAAGAAAVVLASGGLSRAAHGAGLRHLGPAGPGRAAVVDPLESLAAAAAAWGRGARDAWELVADVPEGVPQPAAAPPA